MAGERITAGLLQQLSPAGGLTLLGLELGVQDAIG